MDMNVVLAIFEFVVLLFAISIHDTVQAWVALRKGDPTAQMMGRISLNPAKHFTLFGTLIWPAIFIFQSPLVLGWGKPVPITPRNFRNPDRDEMIVYLSGPLAHLAVAIVCLVLLILFKHLAPGAPYALEVAAGLAKRDTTVPTINLPALFPVVLFLFYGILLNLLLFVFNLLPLPSLDGGKVLRHFLPYNAAQTFDSMSLYLMIGFMLIGFRIIMIFFIPLLVVFDALLRAL
jgi:Zn-dependent protease